MRLPTWVDEYIPYRGACACCADGDARHRIVDEIKREIKAGTPAIELAVDFGYTTAFIERLARYNGAVAHEAGATEPAHRENRARRHRSRHAAA